MSVARSYRVRLAREEDAARLPAIERSAAQSFLAVLGLAWIARDDVLGEASHLGHIHGGTCWVAVDDGDAPFGFLSAERVARRELHIAEMSVSRAFQGKGAGRALLRAAIDWARAQGLRSVTLTTFRDVPWNAPFYRRSGFEIVPPSHLDARLAKLLGKEVGRGFPEGSRCAMRLSLGRSIKSV